jgi:hypothetical protein
MSQCAAAAARERDALAGSPWQPHTARLFSIYFLFSASDDIDVEKLIFSLSPSLSLRSLKNNKFPFPIFLWRTALLSLALSQISIESSFKKRVAPAGDEEKITGGCHSDGEQKSEEQKLLLLLREHQEKKKRTRHARATDSQQHPAIVSRPPE